jgi:hypothetical protein
MNFSPPSVRLTPAGEDEEPARQNLPQTTRNIADPEKKFFICVHLRGLRASNSFPHKQLATESPGYKNILKYFHKKCHFN